MKIWVEHEVADDHIESGTMYKGMKSGHGYTLEELGL